MGLVIASTWAAIDTELEAFAANCNSRVAPALSTTTFAVAFDSASASAFVEVLVKQSRSAVSFMVSQPATISPSCSPSEVSL